MDSKLLLHRGGRNDSGQSAGWFSKGFGSLTHLYTEAGKKNNHKECHSAGGEDFELCQHIHELKQDEVAALFCLLPC